MTKPCRVDCAYLSTFNGCKAQRTLPCLNPKSAIAVGSIAQHLVNQSCFKFRKNALRTSDRTPASKTPIIYLRTARSVRIGDSLRSRIGFSNQFILLLRNACCLKLINKFKGIKSNHSQKIIPISKCVNYASFSKCTADMFLAI